MCMRVFMCLGAYVFIRTPPRVLGLSVYFDLYPSCLYQSFFLSLNLFLDAVTPLRCVAPEGLFFHRGSGGFSPSLTPEDASTSC